MVGNKLLPSACHFCHDTCLYSNGSRGNNTTLKWWALFLGAAYSSKCGNGSRGNNTTLKWWSLILGAAYSSKRGNGSRGNNTTLQWWGLLLGAAYSSKCGNEKEVCTHECVQHHAPLDHDKQAVAHNQHHTVSVGTMCAPVKQWSHSMCLRKAVPSALRPENPTVFTERHTNHTITGLYTHWFTKFRDILSTEVHHSLTRISFWAIQKCTTSGSTLLPGRILCKVVLTTRFTQGVAKLCSASLQNSTICPLLSTQTQNSLLQENSQTLTGNSTSITGKTPWLTGTFHDCHRHEQFSFHSHDFSMSCVRILLVPQTGLLWSGQVHKLQQTHTLETVLARDFFWSCRLCDAGPLHHKSLAVTQLSSNTLENTLWMGRLESNQLSHGLPEGGQWVSVVHILICIPWKPWAPSWACSRAVLPSSPAIHQCFITVHCNRTAIYTTLFNVQVQLSSTHWKYPPYAFGSELCVE